MTVAEFIAQGIGVLTLFLAAQRNDLVQLTSEIEESQTGLRLLTHTDARHLRKVKTVFEHFSQHINLI